MPWRVSLSDDYRKDVVQLWWCATYRQLADNLTKCLTPNTVEFLQVIRSGTPRLGTDSLRPRLTQRAHEFRASELSGRQLFFYYLRTRLEFWKFENQNPQEIGFTDSAIEPEFQWMRDPLDTSEHPLSNDGLKM